MEFSGPCLGVSGLAISPGSREGSDVAFSAPPAAAPQLARLTRAAVRLIADNHSYV